MPALSQGDDTGYERKREEFLKGAAARMTLLTYMLPPEIIALSQGDYNAAAQLMEVGGVE